MAKKTLTFGIKKSKITKSLKSAAKTNSRKVHVVARGGKWAIKSEGAKRAFKIYPSKTSAVKVAKRSVKKGKASSVVIHNKDGKISKRQ